MKHLAILFTILIGFVACNQEDTPEPPTITARISCGNANCETIITLDDNRVIEEEFFQGYEWEYVLMTETDLSIWVNTVDDEYNANISITLLKNDFIIERALFYGDNGKIETSIKP